MCVYPCLMFDRPFYLKILYKNLKKLVRHEVLFIFYHLITLKILIIKKFKRRTIKRWTCSIKLYLFWMDEVIKSYRLLHVRTGVQRECHCCSDKWPAGTCSCRVQ